MILCLYMLWNDHSSKSGNPWSPHTVFLQWELLRFTFPSNFQICNTLLLTIVTMLYITSHDLFITGSCYLSTPFTHFNHSYPLLWRSPICLLCLQVWICSFCFVCFNSTYKWNHTVFIILTSLISLSICLQGPSMLLQMARFHSFSWQK